MDPLTHAYRPRESLRRRLALLIGLPLLVAFIVMIGVQFRVAREMVTESLRQQIRAETQIACLRLESNLLSIEHAVALQSELLRAGSDAFVPLGAEESASRFHAMLSSVLAANPFAFGAAAAFAPGQPGVGDRGFAPYVCRTEGTALREVDLARVEGYDFSQQPWFVGATAAPEGYWSEPYFDRGGGDVTMTTYSMRFAAKRTLPSGVVSADVRLNEILNAAVRSTRGESFDVSIISRGGRIIVSSISDSQMKVASDFAPDDHQRAILEAASKLDGNRADFVRVGDPGLFGIGGTRVVLVRVPTTSWVFAGSFDEQDIVPPVIRSMAFGPGLLLVGAIVALVIVWRSTGSAVRPLAGIVAAIGRFSQGDLSARAPVPAREDEVGTMARAFNEMGGALTVAITQRERAVAERAAVEAQIMAARQIQRVLLPQGDDEASGDARTTSAFAGLSIAATSLPAAEISGDFFDWFARDDGRVVVVVADVCGKGMPAAMLMAVARTLFRRAAIEISDPAQVIARVSHDLASQAPQSSFTTAVIVVIDLASGRVEYANCGHPTGILLHADGTASEAMPSTGTVLGIELEMGWETKSFLLGEGERIVLLSDGVTEAGPPVHQGEAPVLFGDARVLDFLRGQSARKLAMPSEIMDALVGATRAFSCGDQRDDLTVVVIQRNLRGAR